MGEHANLTPAQALAGAMNWWREAGVDLHFVDETHQWIVDSPEEAGIPAPRRAMAMPPPEMEPEVLPPLLAIRDNWPQTLEEFSPWWLQEPALDRGGTSPRVAPRGVTHPELMILVAEPEADDRQELLSGPLGAFLDAMLVAMGIAPERTYRASALPRNTPLADWNAAAHSGMRDLTLHHIDLVQPERVLVFGRNILPLLSHNPAQNPADYCEINHRDRKIPVIVGWDLAALLGRAKARSMFWQRWLDWTDT